MPIKFSRNDLKLSDVLSDIEQGQIGLPDLQRPFVWKDDQVKELLYSMYLGYPIGTLLLWDTESVKTKQIGGGKKASGEENNPNRLIIDGQQRMTSLYGVVRGHPPKFFDGNAQAFSGLRFHLGTETFAFYQPVKMQDDPLWIDVTGLMKAGNAGLGALIDAITLPIQVHDVAPGLTAWLASSGASFGFDEMLAAVSPDVLGLLKLFALPDSPNAIPEPVYAAARDVHRPALQAVLADWFAVNRVDAMLLPATMVAATAIGHDQLIRIGEADVPFSTAMGRNIAPGSTAGLPGLVLPAGLAKGLPVAIELDGPPGADRRLLAIGLAVEALLAEELWPRARRPS